MTDPRNCDLLITGGTVLDLSDPRGHREVPIVIDNGVIVALDDRPDAASYWSARRHVDADGAYVAPGFIDGHVHCSAILAAAQPYAPARGPSTFGGGGGAAEIGRTLDELLSMPVPPDLVEAVVAPLLAAMLIAGTTKVVDAGSAGTDGIAAAARRVGIRMSVGPHIHDVMISEDGRAEPIADPTAVIERAEEWLATTSTAADESSRRLVEPSLAVTEPTYCSDELLERLGALLERTDASVNFHSHETFQSVADHDLAHGRPAIDRLAAHGLLGPRCTLMHAGAVDDRDIDLIASSGTVVNLNPLGNAMLGFGTSSGLALTRLTAAGIPVHYGSDQTPSMIASGFDLIHAALLLTREAGGSDFSLTLPAALTPAFASTIAPGMPADLMIVDRRGPHHLGVDHPVPGLALRGRPSDVRTVVVGGEIAVNEGRAVHVDLDELRRDADAALGFIRDHR